MTIGDNIKKYRELRNLTVEQLAGKLGKKKTSVYEWEAGTYKPGQDSLTKLAAALDVQISDLIEENLTEVNKSTDNNETVIRGHVYTELIERNSDYKLMPTMILTDYSIIPKRILDGHDKEIARQEKLITKYEGLISRLENEIESLRSQLTPKNAQ
jgi:transcriptional regulator with XRE-family HTH domain